jgi:uncharacterized membrane protein YfcA
MDLSVLSASPSRLALACIVAFCASILGGLSALDLQLLLFGLLVGVCTAPGAFVARTLLKRVPAGIHAGFMELVVVVGAIALLWHAW